MMTTNIADGAPRAASRDTNTMSLVRGFSAGSTAAVKTPAVVLIVLGKVAAKSKFYSTLA